MCKILVKLHDWVNVQEVPVNTKAKLGGMGSTRSMDLLKQTADANYCQL